MTATIIQRVVVPDERIQRHLKKQLGAGDKLARFMAEANRAVAGAFAFLPAKAVQPDDLEHGGVTDAAAGRISRERLVEFIADFLMTDPAAGAIFEGDAMGLEETRQPPIPFVTNVPSDVHIWRAPDFTSPASARGIYYVVNSGAGSTDEIRAMLRGARSYPRIGVLTVYESGPPKPGTEVSDEVLAALVRQARYLIVGAYDEETDVIVPLSPEPA